LQKINILTLILLILLIILVLSIPVRRNIAPDNLVEKIALVE
jgi:hypothetical protein